MRRISDILHMGKDFVKIVLGRDYFHQAEQLGDYFKNGRSYYIDFKGKVGWNGKLVDDVPVLYLPSLGKDIFFPSMILQYGIGSIDMYFSTNDSSYLKKVGHVYKWLMNNFEVDYSYNNAFQELDPTVQYHSNNSAMTQAEALSFFARILRHRLLEIDKDKCEDIMKNILENIILPLEKGGGSMYQGDDLFLCEYCRKDGYVVLNGWVFAIYGVLDYHDLFKDHASFRLFWSSIDTLERHIHSYLKNDGWSYYDNRKRLCSPIYQELHIHQVNSLYLLTKRSSFQCILAQLQRGYTWPNILKYGLIKIVDKIKDSYCYSTV